MQLTALITVRELQGYAEKPSLAAAGPKSPNLTSLSPLPRSHGSICRGLEPPSFPASIYSCPVVLAPFVLVPTLSSSPASSSPFLVLPLDVFIAGQQLFVPHARRAPRGGISLFRPGDEERKKGRPAEPGLSRPSSPGSSHQGPDSAGAEVQEKPPARWHRRAKTAPKTRAAARRNLLGSCSPPRLGCQCHWVARYTAHSYVQVVA